MNPPNRATGSSGVFRWRGAAADFHALDLPTPTVGNTHVWQVFADRAAAVAGSTQRDLIDPALAAGAGLDVARRRTGGGLVLVDPKRSVWFDVVLAREDDRVGDDVGRSFDRIGSVLADALSAAGVAASAHRGPGAWDALGRLVCFAGVGPGECLTPDGRKVLGLSQRRTREQVRVQAMAYLEVPVAATLAAIPDRLLPAAADGVSPQPRAAVMAEVGRRTASLGDSRSIGWWHAHLADALLDA
ncbi:MAG: hypothetical protein KDB24_09360 [Microthrixaceae bacterium]|nr:hypothetical protein [Microthrixaceae bacterium]